MSRRTIQMSDYRQALILMRNGKSNREISKLGIVSRTKAKEIRDIASSANWLTSPTMPSNEEIHKMFGNRDFISPQIVPYLDKINTWHGQGITAVVVFRTLKEQFNFGGSYNLVQRYMKTLRSDPEKDATIILKFNPGEYSQVDFGKGPIIYDKDLNKKISSWFFVMTLCWSRHQYAEIVSDQKIATWIGCHRRAFEWFGGIVDTVTIDNAASAIAKASYTDPEATKSYANFAEDCGFIISPCPPYSPEKKGIVESGVKYIKRNFLPLKEFNSLSDANNQLHDWIMNIAGKRKHGTTREQPLSLFETEKQTLRPLPRAFPEFYTWRKLAGNRTCHVRYQQCQYSFPYKYVGKKLWVKIAETNIKIYDNYTLIATHPKLTSAGQVSTLMDHLPPRAKSYLQHDKAWCLSKSKEIGEYCHELINTLLTSKPLDMLRGSQAIIYLKDKYSAKLVNLACKRAIEYGTLRYKSVKQILEKDIIDSANEKKDISDIYKGNSEFYRDIESIYH